jgi:hypothetical protein
MILTFNSMTLKIVIYLEDPDNDDFLDGHLTPCLPDIWELERWINEHWDEVSRGFTKRQDGEAEKKMSRKQEIIARDSIT